MAKGTIKQRRPKDKNMLSRVDKSRVDKSRLDKSRRSPPNDVVPSIEGLPCPQIRAAWRKWRLVEGGGTFEVLSSEKCEERGMIDPDHLPNFRPETHMDLLRSAGYKNIIDHLVIPFGENYTLFVFRLKGGDNVLWLIKSAFGEVFEGNKKKYIERFGTDAASHLHSGSKASKPDDNDDSEDRDDSNDTTEDEDDAGNDTEGVAVTDADSGDESEHESESENEARNEDDDDDDEDTLDRTTPSPKGKSPSPRRSTSTPVTSPKATQSTKGKITYARYTGKILRGIIKKNGLYDIAELKTAPANIIHHEENKGFAPTIDNQFIASLTSYKRLDRSKYKIRGCTGFMRGPKQNWKVVILELTDEQLKEDLQDAREKAKCRYTGPLLCKWSQFETAVRRDKKDIEKAYEFLDKTNLGKALKKTGIEPRSVRHQTYGPEDARMISEGFRQISEKLSEQDKKIKKITSMLEKSRL
ncbi:hypothetical protein IQ07DRAFT_593718 [Pyrenochaeta sp. DS3sAY3a]|nr:hypothetical protein IQ07DRAFT_593718 [Pyrenochaeta sp. DS3sAY3a]